VSFAVEFYLMFEMARFRHGMNRQVYVTLASVLGLACCSPDGSG
jgi:hypothetical protein